MCHEVVASMIVADTATLGRPVIMAIIHKHMTCPPWVLNRPCTPSENTSTVAFPAASGLIKPEAQ